MQWTEQNCIKKSAAKKDITLKYFDMDRIYEMYKVSFHHGFPFRSWSVFEPKIKLIRTKIPNCQISQTNQLNLAFEEQLKEVFINR